MIDTPLLTVKPSHPFTLCIQGQSPRLPSNVYNGVADEMKDFIYAPRFSLQDGYKFSSSRVMVANHYRKKDTRMG